jgi:YVTN family beta-propeller protein
MRPPIALAAILGVAMACAPTRAGDMLPADGAGDRLLLAVGSQVEMHDGKGSLLQTIGRAAAAPDGAVLYAVEPSTVTTVRWIEAKTGVRLTQLALPGRYALPDEDGPAPSGLSPNGRWLVLSAAAGPTSEFAIVDTGAVRLAATVGLTGSFSFDAISDDGTSLYLVERIDAPTARSLGLNTAYGYRVRVYDVPSAKLSPTPVLDVKLAAQTTGDNADTRVDGIMNGIYQSSVAGPGGQWYFSFYQNPSRGPFIHVLHLNARNAFCILDLPNVAGGYEKRLSWSLALAPSGTRLYAVNGPLGLVSAIDTSTLKVLRSVSVERLGTAEPAGGDPAHGAVVAGDGRRLYFAAERGIALVDTSDLTLRGHFLSDERVRSIALSPDGRRLYAVSSAGVWRMDANTGKHAERLAIPAASAILRVDAR